VTAEKPSARYRSMYLRSQNIPTPKSMMIKLIQTIRMAPHLKNCAAKTGFTY
jgi:hypothetical protein